LIPKTKCDHGGMMQCYCWVFSLSRLKCHSLWISECCRPGCM